MEPISWQAPSFHYTEKSGSWYMWSIVVAVAVGVFAVFQGNILFMFFVIMAEAMVLFMSSQKPRLLLYAVDDKKISVEGYREYPFAELAGFALIDNPLSQRYNELVLQPKARLGTYIKILVPIERGEAMKNFLSAHLPVIEYEERLSDTILRRIGL